MHEPYVTYSQKSGKIVDDKGVQVGGGWAGNHRGKNNPDMQNVRNTGPLPRGWYTILDPVEHPKVGHFALRLVPDEGNEMFGRSGFFIHGASMGPHFGEESEGCIVASRPVREAVHAGFKRLLVTA